MGSTYASCGIMKRSFVFLLVGMLLSAMLLETPSHCHGDSCGAQEQHAFLDHSGHDREAPTDKDSGGKDTKLVFHSWHSHVADATVNQSAVPPLHLAAVKLQFVHTEAFATRAVPPLLEPPSLA